MKDLYEAYAALNHASGKQAGICKRRLAWLCAIQGPNVFGFAADVHDFGGNSLHPERHFKGVDAGGNFGIAGDVEMLAIQGGKGIKRVALNGLVDPSGIGEVKHRVSRGAELNPLVKCGQEAATPVGVPPRGTLLAGTEDDESRKVLAF